MGESRKVNTEIYNLVIHKISKPFMIWCAMLAIYISLEVSRLPQYWVNVSGKTLFVLGIISAAFVLSSIAVSIIKIYSTKAESASPVASLIQNISKVMIFGIGILIILNSLGISITPILATLGVGGLAVALALQETLSNLFAGFHIIMARQIRVGDYVKLETGQEGYITDIDWRTTKIRMLPNNVVLVPNSKLTQTIVTNYYLPDKRITFSVAVGVSYDSDLNKVEQVTVNVARDVMKNIKGAVPEFEPSVIYQAFGESSINLNVNLMASEFASQYLIRHEFIKRLHERYKKEGIIIPYPIRTINYPQEKAQ